MEAFSAWAGTDSVVTNAIPTNAITANDVPSISILYYGTFYKKHPNGSEPVMSFYANSGSQCMGIHVICDRCKFIKQYADDETDQYAADMEQWGNKCPKCGRP